MSFDSLRRRWDSNQGDDIRRSKVAMNVAISKSAKTQEAPLWTLLHCNHLVRLGCGSRIYSNAYNRLKSQYHIARLLILPVDASK